MSKYPKTITYEDLDGNKKTTVVKDEFEQRVLENQIEKQMQLKSELDVASEVFSYRMDALRNTFKSKEEQSEDNIKKIKHKLEVGRKEIEVRRKEIEEGRKELEKKKAIKKSNREEENAIRKSEIEQIKKVAAEKRKKIPLFQKIVRFITFVLVLSIIFFLLFWAFPII